MINRIFSHSRTKNHGQSFVELMLVTLILALMLSGVVEFGYLLNCYLKVLDGTREGARYSNMSVPFAVDAATGEFIIDGGTGTYVSSQTFYINTAIEALRVMSPVVPKGNQGDDIVISVFSVAGSSIVRWPFGYVGGWNLCENHEDPALQVNNDLNVDDWSPCVPRASHFSTAQVLLLMDPSAPANGVLIVEVYYNYPQILKLPVFSQVIPDPIPVYTYSIMPLSSAEPTPVPIP